MTSIQLVFPINKMNNTHSFYSPSLEIVRQEQGRKPKAMRPKHAVLSISNKKLAFLTASKPIHLRQRPK